MFHSTRSRILGSLPALLLCAASLPAAQTPYVATVIQPEAEVRCKPSTDGKLYPTNHLRQGARVLVLEERADGWLGIQPPPGSFSWINSKQVHQLFPTQANWVVDNDSVPVLIGGDVVNVPPTVEGVRLLRGTQLHVLGKEVRDGDRVYLPIDPPAGEIRYIRADAVRAEPTPVVQAPAAATNPVADPSKTVTNYTTVSRNTVASTSVAGAQTTALSIPSPTTDNVPHLPANATPWQTAEYYERIGRWTEAEQIYDQLAPALQSTRPEWADFARKRAAYLRNGGRVPLNLSASLPVPDARSPSTFQPAVQQVSPAQVRLSPPLDPSAAPQAQTTSWSSPTLNTQGSDRSGPGQLKHSYRAPDAPYRLEMAEGNFIYAAPGTGVHLEDFVDKGTVELVGTRQYRGDLSAYYMVVSSVQRP